ncbi:FHA domain-containing protein [Nocardioides sp. W3-2-3]|uniref:FHA domain-containing protein n=1 Tax=Nocardioides convexus TaxID=2712224 RepID=UPI00241867CB|nr:FHA domain-containing protein [Nocardioides convexus]NHA00424.1 FHA domain-containing protein [Nocardioides convexus]
MVLPQRTQAGRSLSIGREHTNDIVLDDPLVSRHHARLDPPTGRCSRCCTTSARSTAPSSTATGCRAPCRLPVGAEVIFGNQTFRWDGQQAGRLGDRPRVHPVRRRAHPGRRRRQAADREHLLQAWSRRASPPSSAPPVRASPPCSAR